MRIVFDQGTPVPLRGALVGHSVSTAHELGWSTLKNGELLQRAEADFDALVTTDRSLRHQQNLTDRQLAIVVLPTTSWPRISSHIEEVVSAIESIAAGEYREIRW